MKNYRFYFHTILTFLFLAICPLAVGALDLRNFSFAHLGMQEGISGQRVYSLQQSEDGALWWTTRYGVDRWNGSVVRNYYLDNRSLYSTFAGRVVKFAKQETPSNDLYVFDNTGRIYQYSPVYDRFEEVRNLARLLGSEIVLNDVVVTAEGMWLAMREGLFFLDEQQHLQAVMHNRYVTCLLPLEGGRMMLGTQSGCYFLTGAILRNPFVIPSDQPSLPYNVQSGYFDESQQRLWLGTFNEGVKCLDMRGEEPVVIATQYNLPHNPVRSIAAYDLNTLLVGIDGFGIYQIDRDKASAQLLFDANGGPQGVLHGNGVYDILVDSWSNIIVGSYSGGIDIARPSGSITAIFEHSQSNEQSLVNAHVNCVSTSVPDLLCMGTDDGVSIYHMSDGSWHHQGKGMVVLDICGRPDGSLLLATYGNGVCKVDANGRLSTLYSVGEGTLRDDHVYKLRYDRHGNLWMGCLSGALAVKMAAGGTHYLDVDNVNALLELGDGRMAVGSSHGLYLVDLATADVHQVNYMPAALSDYNQFVQALYQSTDEKLWIATDGGGIYLYDFRTEKSLQITTQHGLPSNSVTSIVADDRGRLWVGSERGLSVILPENPTEVVDMNFHHGLNAEYMVGAACALNDGHILFGTASSAILLNSHNVQRMDYKGWLHLTGIQIREHGEQSVEEVDKQKVQCHDMLQKGELYLEYRQNTFDINYESINLRYQYDIAYQHHLGNSDWSYPSEQQVISFVNLEPGTHHLHLRSLSRTGREVLDERTLVIHIGHPWWTSWWMWCIYALGFVSSLIAAWSVYDLHTRYMQLVVKSIRSKEESAAEQREDLEEKEEASAVEELEEVNSQFVDEVTQVVLNHLHEVDFTIDSLCKELAMSRTLFYVKLKTYTGKSPQDFVRVIRLERAASLLRQGLSVTDVSSKVGFDNPKYFGVVFKKYFGISPSKYK